MPDFILREYRAGDIPALSRLWKTAFEDSDALIADFFRLLPEMGTGLVAVLENRIAGAAYVITGMELINGEGRPVPCGYLYAVATGESCRGLGIGSALSRAAGEEARRRGAAFLCTLPASESLYGWYRELLGVEPALSRAAFPAACTPGEPVIPISAADYGQRREALLKGIPHLRLSPPALGFQQRLCAAYGGGFYAVGRGICAAYREGETAVVRELLGKEEDETASAASVGAALGAETFVLYRPAKAGEPYLAAPPGLIPPNCVWNLSFD